MTATESHNEGHALRDGAAFSWDSLGWALVAAPMVGLVWAWIGNRVQPHFAPWLLFPILLGVFCGLTIVGLTRFAQFGHRRTILLATVLAATAAAVGEHYFSYLSAYQWAPPNGASESGQDLSGIARQVAPSFGEYLRAHAARGRPLFGEYVAANGMAWLSWALDAVLMVVAAVMVARPALRVPYCSRCGTWYRTTRNGKVDVATGRRLAEICGIEEIDRFRSPRYRLAICQGGCSPMRCELSWEESANTINVARVWLTNDQRRQILAALDALSDEGGPIEE